MKIKVKIRKTLNKRREMKENKSTIFNFDSNESKS